MKLYPICLKLNQMKCLVVGGGGVACRKVKTLLESKALVTVVSPKLCKQLDSLHRLKMISYEKSIYNKKFLKGVFLVIAATNQNDVNEQVAYDARQKEILLNVVDVPDLCNFYVPAIVRKDPLLLAVSTQGAFPGAAKMIRKQLKSLVAEKSGSIKILAKIRTHFKQKIKDDNIRAIHIKKLTSPDVIKLVEQRKIKDLKDFKKYYGEHCV